MGIGAGVFLLALGAILAFAVEYEVAGVDLTVVGWILMGAGLLGVLLSLLVWGPRRRARGAVVERHTYDDEPPAY